MLPSQFKDEGVLPLLRMRNGIDKLFEDFFSANGSMAPFKMNGAMMPVIDVQETGEAITVDADLPGLKQEEIKVSVEDGILSISAERKHEKDEKTRNVHRAERYFGRMERRLALPSSVEDTKVEASYKDGVLHVTLPKKASAKAKAVNVKVK